MYKFIIFVCPLSEEGDHRHSQIHLLDLHGLRSVVEAPRGPRRDIDTLAKDCVFETVSPSLVGPRLVVLNLYQFTVLQFIYFL